MDGRLRNVNYLYRRSRTELQVEKAHFRNLQGVSSDRNEMLAWGEGR